METYFIVSPKGISSQPSSNQMTVTSPTPTAPSDPSGHFVSCESAFTNQTKSNSQSLATALSMQQKSDSVSQQNKSQSSSVHCTVSPFDKLDDSEIFGPEDYISSPKQAVSTPSSPTPAHSKRTNMIPRLLCLKTGDLKATSLPSILNQQEAQARIQSNNKSLNVIPTKKPLFWKYTRLKISRKGENTFSTYVVQLI